MWRCKLQRRQAAKPVLAAEEQRQSAAAGEGLSATGSNDGSLSTPWLL